MFMGLAAVLLVTSLAPAQLVVPLPREELPAEAPAAPPPEPPKTSVRSRVTPWINAGFLVAGTAVLSLSGLQLVASSAGAAGVLGLAALAAGQGPVELTRGDIPLPDRPSRLGGPWSISWSYGTNELAVVMGIISSLFMGGSALLASAGLLLMAAGTVFPAVDARGFARFVLRALAFHAVGCMLAVGTVVVGLAVAGLPLTALLFADGPEAAARVLPPQVGPLMLVGALVGVGGMAVLGATAFQLAWTSVWGPPVGDGPG